MTVPSFSISSPLPNTRPAILCLHGELVRGNEEQVVRDCLAQVKRETVALNLSNVERIDAAGISALITLYCSAIEAGHNFSVVDPSPHVLELLRVVGLESILVQPGRDTLRATEESLNRSHEVAQSCRECTAA